MLRQFIYIYIVSARNPLRLPNSILNTATNNTTTITTTTIVCDDIDIEFVVKNLFYGIEVWLVELNMVT